MDTIAFKSFTDFVDKISELAKRKGTLFRGVTSTDHQLIPKVGRQGVLRGGWSKEVERQIFLNFQREAIPFLDYTSPKYSETQWLVIGQHHGLPTRLLDWSDNPLAAAYFAVEEDGTAGDAAVYCLDWPSPVHVEINQIHDISELAVLAPPHISRRVAAQRGFFTVHPEPKVAYENDSLVRLVIRSRECTKFRQTLSRLGIDRAALFPDLDGLARHYLWVYGEGGTS